MNVLIIIPIFQHEEDMPPLLSTRLGVLFNDSDLDSTVEELYKLLLKKLGSKGETSI
ncbi:MAG: hypothetical protein JW891_07460 [Candidatus Lokiarchaeota archaeon]|nr:hypothetical protein [Candidatus Lokiarchaeota archaeon]